jgi:hypothetical protein
MSIKNLYPSIAPSLSLDFAKVKKLDPRITFTRTTTAKFYDGTSVAKAEENLLVRSQEFENATAWSGTTGISAPTANTGDTTAPDGTSTADTITCLATTSAHRIGQGVAISAATQVVSVFAKAGTHNYVQLSIGNQTAHANFDITSGSGVVGTNSGVISSSISDAGNGWYRCVMVYANTSGNSVNVYLVSSSSAARNESWTSVGTESVYLWGAQLEQRSSVTAYTPTTTQPITNYIPALQTAAAGQARFDHNPVTGESLGLLIEEQRTNLLTYSEDFSNWSIVAGTVTTDAWVAPNGLIVGDIVNVQSSTVPSNTATVANSTTYTFSFYFNKSLTTAAFFRIRFGLASGSSSAWVNLSTLAFGTYNSGLSNGQITNVGNNVYRVSLQVAYGASDGGSRAIGIAGVTADGGTTADTGKNLALWGAQLEAGAFPTSYIKTEGSTVTRNADAASMTGTNFSSWYRADEGTFYAEAFSRIHPSTGTRFIAAISNGTSAERISLCSRNPQGIQVVYNNSVVANIDRGLSAEGMYKFAGAYAVNNFNSAVNGTAGTTDTSGNIPVVDRMNIGTNQATADSNMVAGHIKKLAYYGKRLSDAELQALTTV